MDTITFTGQLLVASQNDTCQAINVIFDNTCKSCSNCYDVAIVGIICGAVVLVALFAKIILLHKLETDSEWKTLQADNEKNKRDQECSLEKEKLVLQATLDRERKELQAKLDKEDKELNAKLDREGKELQARLDKEDKELQAKLDSEDKELQAKLDREGKELQARLRREEQENRDYEEVNPKDSQTSHDGAAS